MRSEINLNETQRFLLHLVPQAGAKLRDYFKSGRYSQKQKEGVDFLTQADEEVDAFLREELTKAFPQSQFLIEETAPEDYSALKDTPSLWVIDPMDGTVNFSRGHPNFAISVALVQSGESVLGVVYRPISDEMFWAQKDVEGAFLNYERISVSRTSSLRAAVIAMDWAWDLEKRKLIPRWQDKLLGVTRQIKMMGSAVSDLSSLAEGRIDAYLHSGLKPWDMAATSLIIEKAGGKVTTPSGEKWDVFTPDIFASNGLLHQPILELIRD